MERWFIRGAAFAAGVWLVYRFVTDPGHVLMLAVWLAACFGIILLLGKKRSPTSSS